MSSHAWFSRSAGSLGPLPSLSWCPTCIIRVPTSFLSLFWSSDKKEKDFSLHNSPQKLEKLFFCDWMEEDWIRSDQVLGCFRRQREEQEEGKSVDSCREFIPLFAINRIDESPRNLLTLDFAQFLKIKLNHVVVWYGIRRN